MSRETETHIPADLRSALERFPFLGAEGLHTPELGDLEKAYLRDCIESGYVSSAGACVDRLESELEAFSGADFAAATGVCDSIVCRPSAPGLLRSSTSVLCDSERIS